MRRETGCLGSHSKQVHDGASRWTDENMLWTLVLVASLLLRHPGALAQVLSRATFLPTDSRKMAVVEVAAAVCHHSPFARAVNSVVVGNPPIPVEQLGSVAKARFRQSKSRRCPLRQSADFDTADAKSFGFDQIGARVPCPNRKRVDFLLKV